MEVDCSLYTWNSFFKLQIPKSMNDLDIFELSDCFSGLLSGSLGQILLSYTIHDKNFDWFYYFTNEIFWLNRLSIQPLSTASDSKGKTLALKKIISEKESIQYVFNKNFQHLKLFLVACKYWSGTKLNSSSSKAVVLYKLTVLLRISNCESARTGGGKARVIESNVIDDLLFNQLSSASIPMLNRSTKTFDYIKLSGLHQDFRSSWIDLLQCFLVLHNKNIVLKLLFSRNT